MGEPKRQIMTSVQPCPVCRGKKWYPLIEMDGEMCYYTNSVIHYPPLIDSCVGYSNYFDQCVKCGTVIC